VDLHSENPVVAMLLRGPWTYGARIAMSGRTVDCGRRRGEACPSGDGRPQRPNGAIGLKAKGYNVVINWLTAYDTVPLSVCPNHLYG
jgi:hypothetical protein